MTRLALLALLLSAAAPAFADDPCTHSAPRNLQLDLAGVRNVVFDIGHNELRVDARPGGNGAVTGRACASDAAYLDQLKLTQQKSGDTLVVKAWRDGNSLSGLFGNRYAELRLSATLPDTLPVRLEVGSGDAWVNGTASLDATVGSGDLEIKRVRGKVSAKVGSGDIEIDDVGALHVPSIGSGDVSVRNVRGDVEVGSIGSGDFSLDRAGGRVKIGSIGSGDADVAGAGGAVEVGSIGSGDFEARGAASLSVRSVGSGDIEHRDVRGAVNVPRRR